MQILLDNSRHVWSKTFHTEERIAAWSAKNVRVVRSGCSVYKISPLFKKSLIFFPEFKEGFALFKSLRVEIYKKKKEKNSYLRTCRTVKSKLCTNINGIFSMQLNTNSKVIHLRI